MIKCASGVNNHNVDDSNDVVSAWAGGRIRPGLGRNLKAQLPLSVAQEGEN